MATEQPDASGRNSHIGIILLCIAIVVAHIFVPWKYCQFWLVGSSGALVVALAVMIEGWKILTTPSLDDMPFWGSPEAHTAGRVVVVLVTVGTLIQGYGEKLATVFLACVK